MLNLNHQLNLRHNHQSDLAQGRESIHHNLHKERQSKPCLSLIHLLFFLYFTLYQNPTFMESLLFKSFNLFLRQ